MKVKVKSTPSFLPVQQRAQLAPQQRKEGFIGKFVRIIIDDIKDKLYADRARKREEHERFCRLARGER